MFSTPFTSCSSGAATVSATTFALAPGYVAEMLTVGGTTSGYCAIGSFCSATRPMITMTIERTVAKIGRSTKKRANISSSLRGRLGGRPRAHADFLRRHGPARSRALDPVHDHPFAGCEAVGHGAESVLERAELHGSVLDHVLVVHDQDVLPVLVGADGAVGHQDAGPGLADGDSHAHEHPRRQQPVRIRKHRPHVDRPGRGVGPVFEEVDCTPVWECGRHGGAGQCQILYQL